MRKATDVFGEWARTGKDKGMEEGHASSVDEMLKFSLRERNLINKSFNFLDLGCGNGWVIRRVVKENLCGFALGVDGAEDMIFNAKSRGKEGHYIHADITTYEPSLEFDLVHSMEVMYYLSDPLKIMKKIENTWLKPNGRLIIGIDLYYENADSHSWEGKVNTPMLMLKEVEWVDMLNQAGFTEVENWRANKSNDSAGTLVITGKKA